MLIKLIIPRLKRLRNNNLKNTDYQTSRIKGTQYSITLKQ